MNITFPSFKNVKTYRVAHYKKITTPLLLLIYIGCILSIQETHMQLEELQAELDLIKLESTDPNKKGNSLFAEVSHDLG